MGIGGGLITDPTYLRREKRQVRKAVENQQSPAAPNIESDHVHYSTARDALADLMLH